MYEDEDRQLFDEIYQLWSKTTGAEKCYWMPVRVGYPGDGLNWDIRSVNPETEESVYVGSLKYDDDAEFIAGLHSALPDLIRLLHNAVDEAVRADEHRDEAENEMFKLVVENMELCQEIEELRG